MSRRRHVAARDMYQRATWFAIPLAVCLALAAAGIMFWLVFGDGRCR